MTFHSETADSYEEARKILKEKWEKGQCPSCGCSARDWRVVMDILLMKCEDCGEEEKVTFDGGVDFPLP